MPLSVLVSDILVFQQTVLVRTVKSEILSKSKQELLSKISYQHSLPNESTLNSSVRCTRSPTIRGTACCCFCPWLERSHIFSSFCYPVLQQHYVSLSDEDSAVIICIHCVWCDVVIQYNLRNSIPGRGE